MSLTPEQDAAARAAGSVAVTAGAGTGKTHMLTERYLHHLQVDGLRPLEIVAATFTERAAAELRGRIRSRLRREPALAELTPELEAAQIGTLHSLAGRICREHPDAAAVPYDFAVQDELQQRLWLDRNFRAALAALPPGLGRALVAEIPYGTVAATLRALLADPYTAERALVADPACWPDLVEKERRATYRRLAAGAQWRQAIAVLGAHAGPADDKMEQQRRAALAADAAFAAGEFTAEACLALDTLSRGRGSKKAWGEETLRALKEACGALKECYREGKPIFELRPGPADDTLCRVLPCLREAFDTVRAHLEAVKRAERILDFNDLELHALRALEDQEVQRFYRRRWKAFLVDEFQDTNPVQAELLARLTGIRAGTGSPKSGPWPGSRLTVVGDEKQSIYSFRRADLTVFRTVREAIREQGGDVVSLSTSFRTHRGLIAPLNGVVEPALGELHQPLAGARAEPPGEPPFLSVHLIADGPGLKQFRQRAEANMIGELIASLLAARTPVHDKAGDRLRPVRPGDIAILARTWNALGPYGDELAARGIPTIHAGGGNLLEQREAKDGAALLRFLADPGDDLALASLLRSPFFAVKDRLLLELGTTARRAGSSWWEALGGPSQQGAPQSATTGSLEFASASLGELLAGRSDETPSRLLALADRLTGYTATIANLPGGQRRLADWRGMGEFVRQLERGHGDVFAVCRELRALQSLGDAKVARPGMEAGDAVSLMSVHNAKGLEWPIVIVPDITARSSGRGAAVLFDAGAGAAFKVPDDAGETSEPMLFTLLDQRRRQREANEEARVLYVALTRARDRVLITGSDDAAGRLGMLAAGLEKADVPVSLVTFEPEAAVPRTPLAEPAAAGAGTLLGDVGPGLTELPASSLSSYHACPRRFHFAQVLQHPGAGEGARVASRTGTLTHLALERGITDLDTLARLDSGLPSEHVREALRLADCFRSHQAFAPVRERIERREQRVTLPMRGLLLQGVADAVGADFVLDYKTGRPAEDDGHLLQVALYARALGRPNAFVAYLKTGELVSFGPDRLEAAGDTIERVLGGIGSGDFTASPSEPKCGRCAFASICDDSLAR
jgi:ATP-dependent helicase/nuclease subunit A